MAIKSQKKAREQIKKGYIRVKEKLKEIRQNLLHAITTGPRSGSGKIVLQHFDKLIQIWGGSPATQPLNIGISSIDVNESNEESDMREFGSVSVVSPVSSSLSDGSGTIDNDSHGSSFMNSNQPRKIVQKRRVPSNPVPKLIDSKRRHMERQLKKSLAKAIQHSNETFAQSMQQMSMYIMQAVQGLSRSMEIRSQAMVQPPSYNFHDTSSLIQYNEMQSHANYFQNAGNNFSTCSNS